ncbi:MAG: hypothetical protein EBT05_04450 [Betaproteobacteria bacterium]|nr:hypothetical protein [Betaproteobacteria bacterium]
MPNWHALGEPDQPDEATMLLFRWLILLLLLGAVVSFVFYAGTGEPRYRRYGLIILKWVLISGFGFFAVLILERLA